MKARGQAKAQVQRDSGRRPEPVQAKVKTNSGTHPNLIARAPGAGKVKAEKDPEPQQEQVIGPEQTETR